MTCDYIPPAKQLNECDWNSFGVCSHSQCKKLCGFSNYSILSGTIFFPWNLITTGSLYWFYWLFIFFLSSADAILAPSISSRRDCSHVWNWIVTTLRKRKNVTRHLQVGKSRFFFYFLPKSHRRRYSHVRQSSCSFTDSKTGGINAGSVNRAKTRVLSLCLRSLLQEANVF